MDTDGKIIEGEGIYNFEAPVRYSKDQLAVHIIGYMNDGSGASGIEHAYDEVLKAGAQKVTATYYADGTGRLLTGEDISVTVPDNKSVRGVVLTLDQVLSERLAAGEVDEVVSTMHEPIQAAAVACGTSVTEVGTAAGGLLVRLDDPSRNSCFIERLSTTPHVEAAEEDLTVRPQG